MVPDTLATPQFRAEPGTDESPLLPAADHSDETMRRMRHPFDLQPAVTSPVSGQAAAR